MKSSPASFSCVISLAVSLLLFAHVAVADPQPITAAVFDFEASGEKLTNRGSEVAALLHAELAGSEHLFLVERQQLDAIFAEQELGLAGNVNAQTAAIVGQLTGAKALITGRIFEAGDRHHIVARIISTETGRVFAEKTSYGKIDALENAVEELGEKLSASVAANAETLVAEVETYDEMLERLRGLVTAENLPSISVVVEEEHIRMQVIDPAVETEMKKVLLALGFEVINPGTSTAPADIAIKGEAFSETAGRRGGLVSCRSRVEIEATSTTDGKLLLADRQVSVAVDVAEAVAGKRSLENAALALLERILPKLTAQ